jgi:hypothetical protein
MAVHRRRVDAPRAPDAPQVSEKPLKPRVISAGIRICRLKAKSFEGEAGPHEPGGHLVLHVIVRKDDDFDARIQQRGDDVAPQEVDNRRSVVGGDEYTFGH